VIDPLYVAAREVLFEALEGLGAQRQALVLAGAQALYIHTGSASLAVAEFTTDSDIVIDPGLLKSDPKLAEAMGRAQFRLGVQPGIWLRDRVVSGIPTVIPVDLLVPRAIAGPGNRAAQLGDHGNRTGRIVRGIEGTLVDCTLMSIGALDRQDLRSFDIRVAGPSGLLVAKLHKLADRGSEPELRRLEDKDALDVLRLLRSISTEALAAGLRILREDAIARDVTVEAIELLPRWFGSRAAAGTVMAVRATERLEDPATIAVSCEALCRALIESLD
jgi:hypothetical protein